MLAKFNKGLINLIYKSKMPGLRPLNFIIKLFYKDVRATPLEKNYDLYLRSLFHTPYNYTSYLMFKN
jgi:hypothetical protein